LLPQAERKAVATRRSAGLAEKRFVLIVFIANTLFTKKSLRKKSSLENAPNS
jgi:uncharacterized membrane protein